MSKTFSYKEAVMFGWNMTKKHLQFLLSFTAVLFVVVLLFNLLMGSDVVKSNMLLLFVFQIVYLVIIFVFTAALMWISLRVVDGKSVSWKEISGNEAFFWNVLWKFFLTNILYGIVTMVGFILIIVPGFIWMLKYQFAPYLVIDKKMGVMESMKMSGQITDGYKWTLFGFWIVVMIIELIGLAIFFVGLIVAVPIVMIATAYVYRLIQKGGGNTPFVSEAPKQSQQA